MPETLETVESQIDKLDEKNTALKVKQTAIREQRLELRAKRDQLTLRAHAMRVLSPEQLVALGHIVVLPEPAELRAEEE